MTSFAVSDSIFTDIRRFTQYAGAAYAEDCPSLPYGSTVLNTFNSTTTDTKAILFKDDSAEQIILAFRGSATPRNLDQDFQFGLTPLNLTGTSCPSCNVHSGFQYAYASVQDDISSAVKTAMASNPDSTLVLTGHSLGGGLAALAASSLEGQGEMPIVYSFGEPRNGDAAWAKYMTEKVPNYFRVTHYNDGVPLIPPVLLGFQHHGTELWQSLPDGNTASSTYSCEGSEPTVSPSVEYSCFEN